MKIFGLLFLGGLPMGMPMRRHPRDLHLGGRLRTGFFSGFRGVFGFRFGYHHPRGLHPLLSPEYSISSGSLPLRGMWGSLGFCVEKFSTPNLDSDAWTIIRSRAGLFWGDSINNSGGRKGGQVGSEL